MITVAGSHNFNSNVFHTSIYSLTPIIIMRSHSLFQSLAMSALATNGDALSNSKAPATTSSNAMGRLPFVPQSAAHHEQRPAAWGRRRALESILGGVFVASTTTAANALDMDAFMNSEIEADKKNCDPKRDPKCVPKLTKDEALCQYGMEGGTAKVEACKRARAAGGQVTQKAQGKSPGGAYGN